MYLLPIGAPPESQAAQSEAWSAASAYGALVHDLGKIAVDVNVELADGTTWHPWHGPLDQPYRFKYVKGRDYRLHGAASSLIYASVIPAKALDWLSGFPELWAQLVFAFAGQYEHADILGEIVSQADQASVAQELGGNPGRAMSAPKQSIQRQLAEGLRMLVSEKFKLNQRDGPSDGWLTQDGLWLVSKPAVDQLRAHLLSQGIEHISGRGFTTTRPHPWIESAPQPASFRWAAPAPKICSEAWGNSPDGCKTTFPGEDLLLNQSPKIDLSLTRMPCTCALKCLN